MNGFIIAKTFPLIIGLVLSLAILPKMKIFSASGRFFCKNYDTGNEVRNRSIVEIGGFAIFPILLISLCLSCGFPKWAGLHISIVKDIESAAMRIMQVVAGCSLLYVVGVKHDIYGTGIKARFLALLTASSLFPASNLWIQDLHGLFGIYELLWGGVVLTVVLTMAITITVAILDDIDGSGVGLIAVLSAIFFLLCFKYDFTIGALVASALLGISVPYSALKLFSKTWRKTLIGNAGSYIMGYMLSYLTISIIRQGGDRMPEDIQMVVGSVIMMPMLDVARMVARRVREGRPITTQDRNAMQYCLIRASISPSVTGVAYAVVVISFVALNTIWVITQMPLTTLAILDIVIWIIIQTFIKISIKKHRLKADYNAWDINYGREIWEANVPVEIIVRKQQTFGTMGLPKNFILGNELEFIPDCMSAFERNTKRVMDMLLSVFLLIVTSPLILLCCIMIKLDDGGPALYSQERVGRFGRPFNLYKFRSMSLLAEQDGPELSHLGGDDDPRLTKIGKFLRAHHLDELPQLWNVLCGDMSFIGYRPERKFFIDRIMENDPRYPMLYQIRPGITSYATLYNGYTDTMEKMLRRLSFDLYYLKHRSFWFDVRILWLTFISIVSGKKF